MCIILEQKIGRNLLILTCKHHIFKIIIRNIFNYLQIEHQSNPVLFHFNNFQNVGKKNNDMIKQCRIILFI